MNFIHFTPLKRAYPFVNLATGPENQCAMRMSRAFRATYPDFYEEMLRIGDTLGAWNRVLHRIPRPPRHAERGLERHHGHEAEPVAPPAPPPPAPSTAPSSTTQTRAILRPLGPPVVTQVHHTRRVLSNNESGGPVFSKAQDVADVLVRARFFSQKWVVPKPRLAVSAQEIRDLRNWLHRGGQNGIIFFQNCFSPAPNTPTDQMAEDLPRDGQGDHIDLWVGDPHHRNAPHESAAAAARIGARRTPHHTYLFEPERGFPDGRSDQVWFWPLPL